MIEEPTPAKKSLGEALQSVNRSVLYLVLFVVVSGSLILSELKTIDIPAHTDKWTMDAYTILRNGPPPGRQDVVILDSGFTNSTRGENGGQMEATLRILMRSGSKFAVVSTVEAQCPEIAQRTIDRINLERKKADQKEYRVWEDYVVLGYFPDALTMLQTVQQSIRDAWKNRTTKDATGKERDVFDSPVLKDIRKIEDVKAYVTIAASNAMPVIVARIGKQVPVISMVTGVMYPEQLNYYRSGQLKGLINGLSGCVELEGLMEKGIDSKGEVGGKAEGTPKAAPFPGMKNLARGNSYYLALHAALILLILAIAVGNIGMALVKRSSRS
jgi:hypothetical protein